MSSGKRTILHIGLGDAPPGFNMTDLEIRTLVKQGAEVASASFDDLIVEITFVMSDDIQQDCAEVVRSFKEKLVRFKPYGVIVGGGVRMNAQMTPFLEQILEAVRVEGGGSIRVGFQCSPGDIEDVCRRCFI